MDNFLFSEQESQDIFSEDITVKRHKELQEKANARFCYIMAQLGKIVGREIVWFDFDNEGGENTPGYFDKDLYNDEISFVGEIKHTRNKDFIHYDDCIPTKWLWTNFESQLETEVKNFAEAEKEALVAKKNSNKAKKEAVEAINATLPSLKTAIYDKVAGDILLNINFKTPDRIYHESTLDERHKELESIKDMINIQREQLRATLTSEEFSVIDFKSPDKILHERHAAQSKNKPRIK